MKRILAVILSALLAVCSTAEAKRRTPAKPKATPCPGVYEIDDCKVEGCGSADIDEELNKRKNIRAADGEAILRSIKWMKALKSPRPKADFCAEKPYDRTKLAEFEGQKITVMAWALAARSGSRESCNCRLWLSKDTDNHIVLVDPSLEDPTLEDNERRDSETAEFTPRTRLDHPNFTQEKLESLIDPDWRLGMTATKGKLLVRVTGLLMFDSEHYCGQPLAKGRRNNWEIHPVLKMEYCPEEETCKEDSDENWIDFDND